MTMQQHDKYLSVKQIVYEMRNTHGLIVSENFIRLMLKSGVKRMGFNAKLSDVLSWWEQHPDFSPRGKK